MVWDGYLKAFVTREVVCTDSCEPLLHLVGLKLQIPRKLLAHGGLEASACFLMALKSGLFSALAVDSMKSYSSDSVFCNVALYQACINWNNPGRQGRRPQQSLAIQGPASGSTGSLKFGFD